MKQKKRWCPDTYQWVIVKKRKKKKNTSPKGMDISPECCCKEGKQGRTVDENFHQICDVCGGS